MDPFAPVRAGENLEIPAAAWNTMLAVGRDYNRRKLGEEASPILPARGEAADLIGVLSTAAELLPPFSIQRLGSLVIDPAVDPHGARRRPTFEGHIPASASNTVVITTEGIGPGEIGSAVVAGVAVCKLQVNAAADGYAVPVVGVTDHLTTSPTRGYPILGKGGPVATSGSGVSGSSGSGSGSGSGLVWAVVALGAVSQAASNYRYACISGILYEITTGANGLPVSTAIGCCACGSGSGSGDPVCDACKAHADGPGFDYTPTSACLTVSGLPGVDDGNYVFLWSGLVEGLYPLGSLPGTFCQGGNSPAVPSTLRGPYPQVPGPAIIDVAGFKNAITGQITWVCAVYAYGGTLIYKSVLYGQQDCISNPITFTSWTAPGDTSGILLYGASPVVTVTPGACPSGSGSGSGSGPSGSGSGSGSGPSGSGSGPSGSGSGSGIGHPCSDPVDGDPCELTGGCIGGTANGTWVAASNTAYLSIGGVFYKIVWSYDTSGGGFTGSVWLLYYSLDFGSTWDFMCNGSSTCDSPLVIHFGPTAQDPTCSPVATFT